jgi:hypothetical protein
MPMAQVVTVKVIHIGDDYATVDLHTVSSDKKSLMFDVPLAVGEWLEKVGAYDGTEVL